jgi:hypothetical protein
MRRSVLALLFCLVAAAPLHAQRAWEDARVLPFGTLSFRAAGHQLFATERFTAAGREALPGQQLPVHPDVLGEVPALRAGIADLFAALEREHGQPLPPADAAPALLTAGEFTSRVSFDRRAAPLELAGGILPRVELSLRVPLVREMHHHHGPHFAGATLGSNPNPQHNREVLAAFGFGELGASRFLPVAGSPTGEALATRVAAAGEGELQLPVRPLAFPTYLALLQQAGEAFELEEYDSEWRGAAVEGSARVLLLSRSPVDAQGDARFGVRLAAEGTVRRVLVPAPEPYAEPALGEAMVSATGAGGALLLDLLFGERGELSALLRADGREGRSWTEAAVAPRLRFAGALSLGGIYAVVRAGGSSGEGARAEGAVHLLGGGLSYSTLDAAGSQRRTLPAAAALVYRTALSGDAGFPVVRSLSMEGRVYYDLRRRR